MAAGGTMAQRMGWQSVWWLGAALSLLSLVLVLLFLRMPPWMNAAGGPPEKLPSAGKALANRNIWLLMVAFISFVIPTSASFTFYSIYLTKVRGYSIDHASMTTSLGMLGLLIGSPLAGWVLSLVGRLKTCLTVTLVFLALLLLLPFNIPDALIPVWWILVGLTMGFTPTICYAAAPGIMGRPELAGLGLAVLTLGNSAGGLIGPMYFGAITEKAGWNAGSYSLIPLVIIGLIAGRMTTFPEESPRVG
jgi:predicted MFS family arabinose efflux permease